MMFLFVIHTMVEAQTSNTTFQKVLLTDVLESIEQQNPQILLSKLEEDQQRLQLWKSMSLLAPTIKGEGTWLNFGSPLEAQLLGDGTQDVDCSTFETFGFGDLCTSFSEPLLLREDRIFDGKIQVVYPISALYSIYQGMKSQQSLLDAQHYATQKQILEIQQQVSSIYYELLHLQHVIAFTDETKERLLQTQKRISVMVEQGVVNPLDLQRIDAGILDVDHGKREAEMGFALLQEQISFLTEMNVIPMEPSTEEEARLIERAKKSVIDDQHPELQSILYQRQAAQSGYKASTGQLLPNVVALGAVQQTEVQGPMTPTQQKYVGIAVQGDFQFGQKILQQQQDKIHIQKSIRGYDILHSALELELRSLQYQLDMYLKKRALFEKKVEVEMEALRQANVLFDKNMLTTSELLEQEQKLYDAKLQQEEHIKNLHALAYQIVIHAGESP